MQGNGTSPPDPRRAAPQAGGFTLIELIVAISLVALLVGIIAPNLGALVPSARLDGSSKDIKAKLTMIRSESRIQAKRMEMEFDLDNAQYRIFGSDRVSSINVKVSHPDSMTIAMIEIERVLRREHSIAPGRDNDFSIRDRSEFLETFEETTRTFTF